MKKKALSVVAGVILTAVGLLFHGTASQQVTPAPPSVTLLLTLGLKASKVESWDGVFPGARWRLPKGGTFRRAMR
jgi:xanthosine utilization system XapX-like protein